MGFWKGLACVAGAVGAVVAAPLVLPAAAAAAAAAGSVVAGSAVGTAVAGAAATASTAVASSAVGTAVVGAASTVAATATTAGATVAGVAATAGTAVASSAVGTVVTGAATSAVGAASTVGTAIATSSVGAAVGSAATTAAAAVGTTVPAAAAAGTVGGSMTYSGITAKEAFNNYDDAKRIIENQKAEYDQKTKDLDAVIDTTNKMLEDLNRFKLDIYNTEVKESLTFIAKITKVQETSTDYFDQGTLQSLFSKAELRRMKIGVGLASDLSKKLKEGTSLMTATTGFASQMVGQMGFASTGTAISSLSGAAAKRATLAAFGGGSLASGGGGMAAGQIMLGGLSLVPTAVIMSWKMASNSEKALTEAYEYRGKVAKEIKALDLQKSLLEKGVGTRVNELNSCLQRMRAIYSAKLFPVFQDAVSRNMDQTEVVDFSSCSDDDKNTISLTTHFLKQMVAVMRVKVLNAKGNPNPYARTLLSQIDNDSKIQEAG